MKKLSLVSLVAGDGYLVAGAGTAIATIDDNLRSQEAALARTESAVAERPDDADALAQVLQRQLRHLQRAAEDLDVFLVEAGDQPQLAH